MTIFFSMMPGNSIFPESWNHVSWIPRLLLRYFLHSAGCKCDLCLLTGTGRYFEGNWTVCLRKLDYSWRKLDGLLVETGRSNDGNWTDYWRKLHVLLKEPGRSIYGNWMVRIRKLDGLLTETGWAIDGNWTVYWWKEWSLLMEAVQQIIFILGAQKCDFAKFRNPRFRWHLAFFNSFLSTLEGRKFDFCRVVKHRVQNYQASCEQILRILASWKCDFWRFVKPIFQGTSQWVEIFLIFEA